MKQLVAALSCCSLPLLFSACDADSGLRIDIAVDGVQPGRNVDRIVIDLVASQDDAYPYTCRVATHQIEGDALSFPVTVVVEPGDIRWDCVAIRVRGYLGDDLTIRAEELFCVDLDGEVTNAQLVLDSRCLLNEGEHICAADEVCNQGACQVSDAAPHFAEPPAVWESCSGGEAL